MPWLEHSRRMASKSVLRRGRIPPIRRFAMSPRLIGTSSRTAVTGSRVFLTPVSRRLDQRRSAAGASAAWSCLLAQRHEKRLRRKGRGPRMRRRSLAVKIALRPPHVSPSKGKAVTQDMQTFESKRQWDERRKPHFERTPRESARIPRRALSRSRCASSRRFGFQDRRPDRAKRSRRRWRRRLDRQFVHRARREGALRALRSRRWRRSVQRNRSIA